MANIGTFKKNGKELQGDIVTLNAAAGLVVAGAADSLADGLEAAQGSIDSGAAQARLDALVEVANR